MEMIQQQNFDHRIYQQSNSSYTSPSKYRPQFSLSSTPLPKLPKHNHDRDHHLYRDPYIVISLSLPSQTDQNLSSNELQHDDVNDRNHLSISNNNNIISFKNFPSTTKHIPTAIMFPSLQIFSLLTLEHNVKSSNGLENKLPQN
ncbi:unnamed protein product [Schistosoma margrebowiei]|uniref:Uncharacterized protein n=1 Tax=Schistosoma margrebowiei TaxID=48269 RepID=A0A183NBT0_9TREM|nr:unnamed protein product [Schistosoma margrebowiei]